MPRAIRDGSAGCMVASGRGPPTGRKSMDSTRVGTRCPGQADDRWQLASGRGRSRLRRAGAGAPSSRRLGGHSLDVTRLERDWTWQSPVSCPAGSHRRAWRARVSLPVPVSGPPPFEASISTRSTEPRPRSSLPVAGTPATGFTARSAEYRRRPWCRLPSPIWHIMWQSSDHSVTHKYYLVLLIVILNETGRRMHVHCF